MSFADRRAGPDARTLPGAAGFRIAVVAASATGAARRARALDALGFTAPACALTGETAAFVAATAPDAVLFEATGDIEVDRGALVTLRSSTSAPLLVVGAAGTVPEMELAYDSGADDFCTSQATVAEVDLRLRALLRGGPHRGRPLEQLRIGDLEIDRAARLVRKNEAPVALSPTEFRLLATLAERPGEIIPAPAIIARVWGSEYANERHYLRLYVRYLRKKLEDDPSAPRYIVNRWGTGYALSAGAA